MLIIQDTREQRPLIFNHPYITGTKIETMKIGDYTVEFADGHRPPIVFERKSLQDIFGSLSKGYPRLKKRINQAIQQNIQFIIIIEASLTKVNNGYNKSERSGEVIVQQLFTLLTRHNIMTVYTNSPEEASLFITNFYLSIGKEHIKQAKIKSRESNPKTTNQECLGQGKTA